MQDRVMTYDIDAIYDNGVFRPLEPLSIPRGMRVHLHVEEQPVKDAPATVGDAPPNMMSRAANGCVSPDDGRTAN